MISFWIMLGGVVVAIVFAVLAMALDQSRRYHRFMMPSIWIASAGSTTTIICLIIFLFGPQS